MLLAFACASIVITVVQEARTERVLESLRDLTSPRALVIRDGERVRIAGRDVARGDLIVLSEGDRVAADAIVLQCDDLLTDEALLTGESVPVRKLASARTTGASTPQAGGDDLPFVFSGTLVVRGAGIAEVTATGVRTEIGKIGQAVSTLETETPRLQRQTQRLVTIFAFLSALVVALTVLLYGLYRGGWLEGVLAGIALGMSMLPEEFPVVLTVFLAMGAWRISQARVLTRRASAIESLGAATVLCTDKTGTLTQNRMSIARLVSPEGTSFSPEGTSLSGIPDGFRTLAEMGLWPVPSSRHEPLGRDETPGAARGGGLGADVAGGPAAAPLSRGRSSQAPERLAVGGDGLAAGGRDDRAVAQAGVRHFGRVESVSMKDCLGQGGAGGQLKSAPRTKDVALGEFSSGHGRQRFKQGVELGGCQWPQANDVGRRAAHEDRALRRYRGQRCRDFLGAGAQASHFVAGRRIVLDDLLRQALGANIKAGHSHSAVWFVEHDLCRAAANIHDQHRLVACCAAGDPEEGELTLLVLVENLQRNACPLLDELCHFAAIGGAA